MPFITKEVKSPGPCPYVAVINGGFTTGKSVRIKGNIPADIERFSVNLQAGPSTEFDDNIALHVNPRFPEEVIVRNSKSGGEWGSEENEGTFSLVPGEDFEIVITNEGESYKIEVNGEILPHFGHRLPAESVNHVVVHENITLSQIQCEKCSDECAIPYCEVIEGGFGPGRSVTVQGLVSSSPERIEVNLQCGPDRENDDLALHINPRFDNEVVVRNSKSGGDWGSEERDGELKLAPGEVFDITIRNDGNSYKIEINGDHLADYNHRLPGDKVSHLSVFGDVELTLIEFQ